MLKRSSIIMILLSTLTLTSKTASCQTVTYNWLQQHDSAQSIQYRIQTPDSYERTETSSDGFAGWLRQLPLKKGKAPVYLYSGEKKTNQDAHFTVIDIDIGDKDLQQCADAIIRLRAEYLYYIKNYDSIHFNFTSGDTASFSKWIEGYRPTVTRNKVRWVKSATIDSSYANFRRYLNEVFTYAGTYSLSKELLRVQDVNEMKIGDVFIEGGFPGHAAIIVDIAINNETGNKILLLAQSYTPAQSIYIIRNPNDPILDPWYKVNFGDTLYTPEWTFTKSDLKRFRQKENPQK